MKRLNPNAIFIYLLLLIFTVAGVLSQARAEGQDDGPLTVSILQKKLDEIVSEQDSALLAQRIRLWIGADTLAKAPVTRIEGLLVAWIIEAPGAKKPPRVVSEDGKFVQTLEHIAGTDLYASVVSRPAGEYLRYTFEANGEKIGGGAYEVFPIAPENLVDRTVPEGTLKQMPRWKSKVFPGTERDWWVYVPAQYRPDKPACVTVFQDGRGYSTYIPTVFDNLIAKGDMPVTVGIFLEPGTVSNNGKPASNRSVEYDALSGQYARFLLEEILPAVEKSTKLRHDAASRAIAGASSGGVCAFTVAWERPDQFSKVISWVGSFTGIAAGKSLKEGANNYPVLIRKTRPAKPIRVFLQDGENDLDNENGNWPLANQQMAKALEFVNYDFKFVLGQGAHSATHGRAILPETLRWIWRDYKDQ